MVSQPSTVLCLCRHFEVFSDQVSFEPVGGRPVAAERGCRHQEAGVYDYVMKFYQKYFSSSIKRYMPQYSVPSMSAM